MPQDPKQVIASVLQAKSPEEALSILEQQGFALVATGAGVGGDVGGAAPVDDMAAPEAGAEPPAGPLSMEGHRAAIMKKYAQAINGAEASDAVP